MIEPFQYEPIKSPFNQKLREFRLRFIPVIVFGAVLIFVIYLWDLRVNNPSFIGLVHAEVAMLTSPQTGLITNMLASDFDRLQTGDPIATIVIVDSYLIKSRIDVILSQIDLVKATLDPLSDWQRNRINLASLRVDLVQERVELSSLEIRKNQQTRNVDRFYQLFKSGLGSAQELEDATLALDLISSEIEVRQQHIIELEDYFSKMKFSDQQYNINETDILTSAIRVYESELAALEAELQPVVIRAPFDGVVAQTFFSNGSYLPAGEVFVRYESSKPTHIIGYIRQPLTVRPHIGMIVQIRTRTAQKFIAPAVIENVGVQLSIMEESLQRPGAHFESALPIKISLSGLEGITLTAGEIVDIIISGQRGN
jgi:multidrug resistance efflux pump